jgi:hypothetical protein
MITIMEEAPGRFTVGPGSLKETTARSLRAQTVPVSIATEPEEMRQAPNFESRTLLVTAAMAAAAAGVAAGLTGSCDWPPQAGGINDAGRLCAHHSAAQPKFEWIVL